MFRKNPHKLQYHNIPSQGGAIAISPTEGDTHAEKDKLCHFVESLITPMLDNTDEAKELNIYIGTGLHMFDTYAAIQAKSKKKNEISFRPYQFTQLTDGKAAFRQGQANGIKWLTDKAGALCEGVKNALEAKMPEVAKLKEQRIYIYTPGQEAELFERGNTFETKGQPDLIVRTHQWHSLWLNRESELIEKLSKVLTYFKQGQALLQSKADSDIYIDLAGTGMSAKLIDEINSKVRMNKLLPFTDTEYQYVADVLGLNESAFIQTIKTQAGAQLDRNMCLNVYAKIMMATWQYFKQKTAPHCKQYTDAGIIQAQIEAVFRANLMFTIAEVATLTFFPGHILYMVPASMDKIYPHLNACTELLYRQTLSVPIRATDPKLVNSVPVEDQEYDNNNNNIRQDSSSSASTSSRLQLSGGYLSQIDQHTLQSKCISYVALAVDEADLEGKLFTAQCLVMAWKNGQQTQAADTKRPNMSNTNGNANS